MSIVQLPHSSTLSNWLAWLKPVSTLAGWNGSVMYMSQQAGHNLACTLNLDSGKWGNSIIPNWTALCIRKVLRVHCEFLDMRGVYVHKHTPLRCTQLKQRDVFAPCRIYVACSIGAGVSETQFHLPLSYQLRTGSQWILIQVTWNKFLFSIYMYLMVKGVILQVWNNAGTRGPPMPNHSKQATCASLT